MNEPSPDDADRICARQAKPEPSLYQPGSHRYAAVAAAALNRREVLQEIERLLASPVRCPECREPVGWHPPAEHDAECFIGVALARVRALLAEPEPSPIRGRWDDQIVKVAATLAFDQEDAAYHFRRLSEGAAPDSEAWVSRTVLENAGVVPVPDEQAIERAAKAIPSYVISGVADEWQDVARLEVARAVLTTALEQPE